MELFGQLAYGFELALTPQNLLFCFLGGLEFVSGAMIGAFALTILFELLSQFQQYQTLIYGVLMIGVILLLPNGLMAIRAAAKEGRA